MYGITNPNFTETFSTVQELIEAVIEFGADPNWPLTRDGRETGDLLIELIVP